MAEGIYVIEDRDHTELMPNITLITGRDAVLVVDTGLGVARAQATLDAARRLAGTRKLYLSATHFHPEHSFGAQVFKRDATFIASRAQRDELQQKFAPYLKLFEQFGAGEALRGVELALPDIVYGDEAELDLGGRVVQFRQVGPAHTRGDQVISVPAQGVVMLGDLMETDSFPIFPWFPEIGDVDVEPMKWRAVLSRVAETRPQVVIPGHGPVTDLRGLNALIDHLKFAEQEVRRSCHSGKGLAALQAEIGPRLKATHPSWYLASWIPKEIEVYHTRLCR